MAQGEEHIVVVADKYCEYAADEQKLKQNDRRVPLRVEQ